MKTSDFRKPITSSQIKENLNKHFGAKVNLEKYSREQLEDMRNKLRTRVFQQEGQAGINDLLTSETYQKDKAMLTLLNTRIKEMLGEDIKKLRDKLQQLEEAKKGVVAPKYKTHPKGSKGTGDGNLANNYPPYDKVTRGDVVAGATGKDQKGGKAMKEESVEEGKKKPDANKNGVPDYAEDGKGSKDLKNKKMKEDSASDDEKKRAASWAAATEPKKPEATKPGETTRTGHKKKEVKPGVTRYTKESAKSCNHTPKGEMCEVHGMKECGTMEEAKEVNAFKVGMAKAKKEAGIEEKPAKNLPKKVVKKGHEIGKAIKKAQKDESVNIFRRHVKIVNESLGYLLAEDEEEKAKAITAASDMVNDFTSWMQRVGQYQTKVMIELSDEIRHNFGAAESEAFKQAVGPALSATLETLTSQREAISAAVATLAGEQMPTEPMGTEPAMEPAPAPEMPMEPTSPDEMNTPPDEFAASDAAAGAASTAGREMRESSFARKLAESHSIISKLAR